MQELNKQLEELLIEDCDGCENLYVKDEHGIYKYSNTFIVDRW